MLSTIHQIDIKNQLKHWSNITLTKNTKKVYEYSIVSLINKGFEIENTNHLYLDAFFKDLDIKSESSGSLRNKLSALSSFYNYLVTKQEIELNPIRLMSYKIKPKNNISKIRKRALSLDLINEMYSQMDKETKKNGNEHLSIYLIKMLLNTGCRISELLSLEIYDPKKENDSYINYIKIENDKSYVYLEGKGSRVREFYLNKTVTKFLLTHKIKKGEKIFRNRLGKPLSRHGAYYQIKAAQKRYLNDIEIYKFSPHSFRHSYISIQVQRNISPINIAKTVGNSTQMIENTYLSQPADINENFSIV